MAGQKIVLGKGWKMKDGKPVRSGKGKSVSQKIAERKNPKRKWGKLCRVSLWRGKLWLRSQDRNETGLSEAGSKQQI